MTSGDPRPAKAALRRRLRSARDELHARYHAEASVRAVERLAESALLDGAGTVALYAAIRQEIDPVGLERALERRGARIVYPRVAGEDLEFALSSLAALAPAPPWGILEPPPGATAVDLRAIDAIVIPGLAFTRSGHRLGYGRGYYDRTLRALRSQRSTAAIGFAFAFQLVEALPFGESDEPVDAVVTDEELVSLGGRR